MLINQKETKRFIIREAQRLRPEAGIEMVSQKALSILNAQLKLKIQDALRRHPSGRKKFTEVM